VVILMKRLLLACLFALPACFSPDQPPCAFACSDDGKCPEEYLCLSDGYCHLHGQMTACGFTDAAAAPDAGQDASASSMSQPDLLATD
jgi:hypothetical protein